MNSMFFGCSTLKELNLSSFNIDNVSNLSHMFSYCFSLKELKFPNFNTNNFKDINDIFEGCPLLRNFNELEKEKRKKKEYACLFF